MDSNNNLNYLKSGVDLNKAANLKENMKSLLSKHQKENNIGNFGGLFEIKGYKNPVLVSSTDGVGSKLLVYSELNKYNLLGQDLVNLSVNDIVCIGAYPLFFLDYIAVEKINEENILAIITGIVKACEENNCKLVGGETAQMAEVYTNGYSLVRKVFELEENKNTLFQQFDELNSTLGEELSKPHISYLPVIKKIENYMKISAHITGGGFIENIPRVINENLDAIINLGSWEINPIFNLIQKYGKISDQEMFNVFNMGIGLVVVATEENSEKILSECKNASIIGYLQENQNLKSKVIIN